MKRIISTDDHLQQSALTLKRSYVSVRTCKWYREFRAVVLMYLVDNTQIMNGWRMKLKISNYKESDTLRL